MREILFRGKCNEIGKKCGQWIEGFYAKDDGKPLIAINKDNGLNGYFVDPSTVGQFTGLTDKNGKKIFEGDVIRVKYSIRLPIGFGNSLRIATHDIDYIASVIFDECRFYSTKANGDACEIPLDSENIEIIGNIHDNPELLEVVK